MVNYISDMSKCKTPKVTFGEEVHKSVQLGKNFFPKRKKNHGHFSFHMFPLLHFKKLFS
jgi:hypothetical protein